MSRKSSESSSPIPDLAYDVITLIHEKAKGLEAYEKYMEDAADDSDLSELLERVREQDQQSVLELRTHLVRLLEEGSDEMGGDSDDEDDDAATTASRTSAQSTSRKR